MAGRLTITVIRARRLKCTVADGKPDPYVKVYLICQGKRIRKQKTHVRHKTLYPLFNEALFFDIPEKNIDDVTLILQVMDYERFRTNAFMGCAAIGSKVIGMGREHWLEMRMNPRTPMTQWYTLTDSIPGINLDNNVAAKSLSLSCLNSRYV
ncbi:hypothetical protein HHI36_011653 [Cryptolaemus montrouzieri]|uniref:C2 domain-containing protein n=1 Tax=Cryptolaemus montrouzieri TaxID=559131 RepID=A0ABD2MME5_9CUCU